MESKCGSGLSSGPYRATKLWNEIVQEFCNGIPLRKHRRQMRQYSDCFTAHDAVDWLHHFLQSNPNFGPDVTRLQAVQLLSKLQQCNIITAVGIQNIIFADNQDLFKLGCNSVSSQGREPLKAYNNKTVASEEKPKLTVEETDYVWKSVVLERLQLALDLENLESILDGCQVNPKYIIHNANRVGTSGIVESLRKSEEIPSWVTSAMKCLAFWPKASGNESCLPKYPGFEKDVFKVIRDYFLNLEEPLSTFGMYHVLIAIYDRVNYLKSCSDLNLDPKACLETEFITEEPVTRIISPPRHYASSSSISYLSERSPSVKLSPKDSYGRAVSMDDFLKPSQNRGSFRDKLRQKLNINTKTSSRCSLNIQSATVSYNTTLDDEEEKHLEKEILWVMKRAKNNPSFSSSSASFHTAPTSQHTGQFSHTCKSIVTDWQKLYIECLRLSLLILSPDTRRSLHILLRFMDKVSRNEQLKIVETYSNQDLMLITFATTILYPKKQAQVNKAKIAALVKFLMDNQEEIFITSENLKSDVESRMNLFFEQKARNSSPNLLTYCEKVSQEEYERQKSECFETAMLELITNILTNDQLSDKEKSKKLKQFKKMHPDIYKKAVPTDQHLTNQRKTSSSQILKKLRALRV